MVAAGDVDEYYCVCASAVFVFTKIEIYGPTVLSTARH